MVLLVTDLVLLESELVLPASLLVWCLVVDVLLLVCESPVSLCAIWLARSPPPLITVVTVSRACVSLTPRWPRVLCPVLLLRPVIARSSESLIDLPLSVYPLVCFDLTLVMVLVTPVVTWLCVVTVLCLRSDS